ncbi:MAG: HAMP domain-containing histidine kinase [Paludibacteraceae bacterium]|nr:HAMP domain-containing histidine kinase [Paludibacteraceae bacterium]
MKSIYGLKRFLKYFFILLSFAIAGLSLFVTNVLVRKLSSEERSRMELWANATRELINVENFDTDLSFVQSVIEANHTIPVILLDAKGELLSYRNMDSLMLNDSLEIDRIKNLHEPIEVPVNDGEVQYIYYDDSLLLKQLSYFPFVQIVVVALFLFLVFFAFFSIQKAEQDKIWVGLSRETAHQLGTPISSLLAWNEILKNRYPEEAYLYEMEKDVDRLRVIAERFSKIGSKPELTECSLQEELSSVISYMRKRTSQKVNYVFDAKNTNTKVWINADLFHWVIENLCKNGIDAMEGIGSLTFKIKEDSKNVAIDVIDNGKGIPKSKLKTIFNPGYTTKKRGWGLGLSLAKRIIEEYHRGKIFVKHSEPNFGTTFRIILQKVTKD